MGQTGKAFYVEQELVPGHLAAAQEPKKTVDVDCMAVPALVLPLHRA